MISESDACVSNPSFVSRGTNFSVLRAVSLPFDHTPITVTMTLPDVDLENLLVRAQRLSDHAVLYNNINSNRNVRKPLSWSSEDESVLEETIENFCNNLHDCAKRNRRDTTHLVDNPVLERWERLVQSEDDLKLGKAINWRGEYVQDFQNDEASSDDEFKRFFEANFDLPDNVNLSEQNFESNIYAPLSDDQILSIKVLTQTKLLKTNKACGADGLRPGIFKIMPAQWILFLCNIFNTIFMQSNYSLIWSRAKLATVFK